MRGWIGLSLLVTALLDASPAMAQDADALRRELEQVRKQFEAMKESYEKAIGDLSRRIDAVEKQSPPAAAPPAAPPPPLAAKAEPSAALASGPPSAMDLARPREPFALYEKRGAGQLLFDVGMTGDFIGNGTAFNVEKAQGGTFSGLENRFFPREIELALFGQIDPYARAEVRIEAGAEDRSGNVSVSLAEANLTLMTLPFGTQAKLGLMRNRFGLTNATHEHDLPFIDRPNVLVRFLGPDGLVETGVEATWVPPLPFFLELLGGVFDGDNDTAFGRGNFRAPLATGRVRTFFDLEELGAFQLGASVASGQTSDRKPSTLIGLDAKYKYKPEGWERALFSIGGEYLHAIRDVAVSDPDPGASATRTNQRNGWYVYGEVQPVRFGVLSRWSLGLRYDWTEFPENPGHEWAIQPYLTFAPSEFLRFRLGYKHTERSSREGVNLNGGSARYVDELLLQATFILGAHPAHPF